MHPLHRPEHGKFSNTPQSLATNFCPKGADAILSIVQHATITARVPWVPGWSLARSGVRMQRGHNNSSFVPGAHALRPILRGQNRSRARRLARVLRRVCAASRNASCSEKTPSNLHGLKAHPYRAPGRGSCEQRVDSGRRRQRYRNNKAYFGGRREDTAPSDIAPPASACPATTAVGSNVSIGAGMPTAKPCT